MTGNFGGWWRLPHFALSVRTSADFVILMPSRCEHDGRDPMLASFVVLSCLRHSRLDLPGHFPLFEEAMREADLPAEQPEAQKEARISSADEEPGGSSCAAVTPSARPRPDFGLIHRVRSHATFAALARVRPRRDGPLWVRRVDGVGIAYPEVAYAIGRASGNAVMRNRLRRQLRAVVHQHFELLRPGSAYLIGVTKFGREASFQELSDSYARCLGTKK